MIFELDNTIRIHTRVVYTLLDLFGDFGGVLEVFYVILTFLIGPWAEHSFLKKALRKLYLYKTIDAEFFK